MEAQEKKKRVPKNPIKFNIVLNEEQKRAKEIILGAKITAIRGAAGSGKSLLAAQVALDLLFKGDVEKIILTRPAVTAGEEIGFLPGSIDEKLAPYLAAIYDNMNTLYSEDKIKSCIEEGKIEVIPLAFMRGRNLSHCVVVIDEAQNITNRQMKLILGRLCKGSRMVLCGDVDQIDLKDEKLSGFDFICTHFEKVPNFALVTLLTNHRDPIVEEILKVYDQHKI